MEMEVYFWTNERNRKKPRWNWFAMLEGWEIFFMLKIEGDSKLFRQTVGVFDNFSKNVSIGIFRQIVGNSDFPKWLKNFIVIFFYSWKVLIFPRLKMCKLSPQKINLNMWCVKVDKNFKLEIKIAYF